MNKCCAGSELWVMLDPWVLSDIHIKRTEENMLCLCICVYIYICWKFSGKDTAFECPSYSS